MKKFFITLIGILVISLFTGIDFASADEYQGKSLEESYEDAINGISNISLDELYDFSTNVEVKNKSFSSDERLNVKEYKTAEILSKSNDSTEIMITTFHDISVEEDGNMIKPSIDDQVDDKFDSSYSVQAFSRIFVSLATIDNMPHAKLTRVTGGWNHLDYTVSLSNRKVIYGSIGAPATTLQRVITYPSGNSFSYNAPSSWVHVNLNFLHQVGANSFITLTKGSSVWDLELFNTW